MASKGFCDSTRSPTEDPKGPNQLGANQNILNLTEIGFLQFIILKIYVGHVKNKYAKHLQIKPRALKDLWERAYGHMIDSRHKGVIRSKIGVALAHGIIFTLRHHYERHHQRMFPHGGPDPREAKFSNFELSLKALESYGDSKGTILCLIQEEPARVCRENRRRTHVFRDEVESEGCED